MERVLLITTENPYPPDSGGRLRVRAIVDTLAKEYEVDLVTFERPDSPELQEARTRLNLVQVPKTMTPKMAALRGLYRMRTAGYMGHADVDMMRSAKQLCRQFRYRDVFIDNTMLGYFIAPLRRLQPKARFVTISHNFETALVQQFVDTQTSAFRRRFFAISVFHTRRMERRVCQQSDLLLVTSTDEAKHFIALWPGARAKISVIPSSIAVDAYARYRDRAPTAESIVLSGHMSYFPNVAGAQFFHERVYPLLKAERPALTWSIVGRAPHASIAALAAQDPAITVTGEVADAAEYVAKSAVVVVPLLHGSGTRLKILEAWAVDRPVVSTSKGCEGIACRHNHDIVIADTPEAFAAAVRRLLDDPAFAAAIARNARQTLLSLYDTPTVERRLLAVLRQDAARGVRAARPQPAGAREALG